MQTLVVMSRKGGAGKTTVAVNLAVTAQASGRRVLLADLDTQRSASDALKQRPRMSPAVFEATAGKLFQLRAAAQRERFDLMIIDTPSAPETEVLEAVRNADFCLMVSRPTFLDIASVVRSGEMVRRLGRPYATVLNQAPALRQGAETPPVLKAMEALKMAGMKPAPVGLRARPTFQTAMTLGLSAGEYRPGSPGATEIELLWSFVSQQLQPARAANQSFAPERQSLQA